MKSSIPLKRKRTIDEVGVAKPIGDVGITLKIKKQKLESSCSPQESLIIGDESLVPLQFHLLPQELPLDLPVIPDVPLIVGVAKPIEENPVKKYSGKKKWAENNPVIYHENQRGYSKKYYTANREMILLKQRENRKLIRELINKEGENFRLFLNELHKDKQDSSS